MGRERAEPWHLNYAPHLGYRAAAEPLLQASAPADPVSQIRRAAALGFAGVQYPWAVGRPVEERAAVARALKDTGLQAGCVVWAPPEDIRRPLLGEEAAGPVIDGLMRSAIAGARQIGARVIAVLGAAGDHASAGMQRQIMARHLRRAAAMAADEGMTLGLEPLGSLPGMLMQTLADGLEVIAQADSPAIRLIYDTGHVEMMDGDAAGRLEGVMAQLCLVQFADQPGRVEPGAGGIDFMRLMSVLMARGYRGLVELEHGWSKPGPEGEAEGLARLRRLDAAAFAAASEKRNGS